VGKVEGKWLRRSARGRREMGGGYG